MASAKITDFGFDWGPMKIERLMSTEAGYVVLLVKTPRGALEIVSTPTGLLSWKHQKKKKSK